MDEALKKVYDMIGGLPQYMAVQQQVCQSLCLCSSVSVSVCPYPAVMSFLAVSLRTLKRTSWSTDNLQSTNVRVSVTAQCKSNVITCILDIVHGEPASVLVLLLTFDNVSLLRGV